uniref:Interferon-induced protein 44 n=1 Tax=Magallana gigas TaxID=29159 RepID=K1RB26_MAGGI
MLILFINVFKRSTELLTEDDRAQFSSWIGQRSRFELLYKISRDGCSSKTFHQLCDGKGPTVTILYNTDNTAYGGFLSRSWASSGTHIKDSKSFLFTLSYNGVQNRRKFPVTDPKKAAFGHVYFGPTFGVVKESNWFEGELSKFPLKLLLENSSDLTTFSDAVTASRDKGSDTYFFNLNGRSDFGLAYQKPTVNMNAINNGHMCVFDLEVYLVKDFVSSYNPLPDMKISELRKYRIRNRETESYLNFRLCDTRGLEEEMSMHLQDMALLLDGHLSDQYKFNPMAHATQRDPGFVLNATFQDKIHCVAFVVDASSIDVLQANVSQKLLHFRSLIVERGIPNVVYLTKLDKVCPVVDEDVRRVYHSQACKQALETAADVIGIPRGHVFPVKNYEKESQLQTNISILALTAMRQTLVFADDYLEDKYELSQSQQ